MTTMLTYAPRRLESRSVLAVQGCRLKRYELRSAEQQSRAGFTDGQWQEALHGRLLLNNDVREHRVGFAILHYGRDGDYLLASLWYGGNMLKHEAFALSSSGDSPYCASLSASRIVACVWELSVMAFERDAWVRTAMTHDGSSAALEDYLGMSFRGWV
jgi:hypothetical protein